LTQEATIHAKTMIRFTRFASRFADTMDVVEVPDLQGLGDLILATDAPDKASLPWLKLAILSGVPNPASKSSRPSLRYDDAVWGLTGAESDYDKGEMSIDTAAGLLALHGIEALVFATASYTPATPRWRVLTPTSVIVEPERRARLVARVNGALGGVLAPESFTLSQAYYYGNAFGQVRYVEGRPIDLCDDLDAIAIYRNGTNRPDMTVHGQRRAPADLAEVDGDHAVLGPEARRMAHNFVAAHGRWTMPRGSRAYQLAQTLGDLRHDGAYLSDAAIYEIMEQAGGDIEYDLLDRRENERGAYQVSSPWSVAAHLIEAPAEDAPLPQPQTPRKPGPDLRTDLERGMEPEEIAWLWRGWLALGKMHLLAGNKGAGKSTIAMDLAARLTAGAPWPDGQTGAEPCEVLFWTGEDDWRDTLYPRYLVSGGVRGKLRPLEHYHGAAGDTRYFDPATDIAALSAALDAFPLVRYVVLDPIVSVMPAKTDGHDNTQTRAGLMPIRLLAVKHHICVLGITHFSKSTEGKRPLDRITGSLAYGAVPRLAFGAVSDEEGNGRFARVAANIAASGGGFEYSLVREPVPGRTMVAQRPKWGQHLTGSAQDIFSDGQDNGTKLAEARAIIMRELEEHPVHCVLVTEMERALRAKDISKKTALRAVKKYNLPVEVGVRVGDGGPYCWVQIDPATGARLGVIR
jgi:putative DNA primase/helicase